MAITEPTTANDEPRSEFRPVLGRIPILALSPQVDDGLWPAKAFSGEVVPFGATTFREGHDVIGVDLLLVDPDGVQTEHRMTPAEPGTDRWLVLVQVEAEGMWRFQVKAYADEYATWLHDAAVKIPAGVDVELMLTTGAGLLERAKADKRHGTAERRRLGEAAKTLAKRDLPADARLAAATDLRIVDILAARPLIDLPTLSPTRSIRVERTRAGVGSWYEFFPRSEGAKKNADGLWKSGTFRTAARRLPEIAAMGFDVVYLPPIHPIGRAFRKGPNNSLNAGTNDPGRGQSAQPRAVTTRSIRISVRRRTSRTSSARRSRPDSRSRSTSPFRHPPITPG
jgi:starch synthase (maltosyl-transferring)